MSKPAPVTVSLQQFAEELILREATPFRKFEDFVKKVAAVPKEEVDEKRREEEQEKRAG